MQIEVTTLQEIEPVL